MSGALDELAKEDSATTGSAGAGDGDQTMRSAGVGGMGAGAAQRPFGIVPATGSGNPFSGGGAGNPFSGGGALGSPFGAFGAPALGAPNGGSSLVSTPGSTFGFGFTPAPRSPPMRRDSSPTGGLAGQPRRLSGFKRSARDSLGPDLSPEVMAARAARKLAKASARKLPARRDASPAFSASSNSDDEEGPGRKQRAFEFGVKAAGGPGAEGLAATIAAGVSMDPQAFARGCKAAEVAAKAAARVKQRRAMEKGGASSSQAGSAPSALAPGAVGRQKRISGARKAATAAAAAAAPPRRAASNVVLLALNGSRANRAGVSPSASSFGLGVQAEPAGAMAPKNAAASILGLGGLPSHTPGFLLSGLPSPARSAQP